MLIMSLWHRYPIPKQQPEISVLMQSFLDKMTQFIKSNIILKPCAFQNAAVEVLYQYLETCWSIGREGCNAQWGQWVRWQGAARGQLHCSEWISSWMTLILIASIRPLSHRFRFPQRHDSEKQSKISLVRQVSSFWSNCCVNGVRVYKREISFGWFAVYE